MLQMYPMLLQDLPLYIQNEILSSGELLYFSDYTEIFNTFMKTIREFEETEKSISFINSKTLEDYFKDVQNLAVWFQSKPPKTTDVSITALREFFLTNGICRVVTSNLCKYEK